MTDRTGSIILPKGHANQNTADRWKLRQGTILYETVDMMDSLAQHAIIHAAMAKQGYHTATFRHAGNRLDQRAGKIELEPA